MVLGLISDGSWTAVGWFLGSRRIDLGLVSAGWKGDVGWSHLNGLISDASCAGVGWFFGCRWKILLGLMLDGSWAGFGWFWAGFGWFLG